MCRFEYVMEGLSDEHENINFSREKTSKIASVE